MMIFNNCLYLPGGEKPGKYDMLLWHLWGFLILAYTVPPRRQIAQQRRHDLWYLWWCLIITYLPGGEELSKDDMWHLQGFLKLYCTSQAAKIIAKTTCCCGIYGVFTTCLYLPGSEEPSKDDMLLWHLWEFLELATSSSKTAKSTAKTPCCRGIYEHF